MKNDNELTSTQIENWRKLLVGMLGPYALMASAHDVRVFKDKMQKTIDEWIEADMPGRETRAPVGIFHK